MYKQTTLLTTNNFKTVKGLKYGFTTYIMYLSPFTDNSKGINLCSHASKGCSASCLFKSGFGGMYENVINGRRNRTEWFLANRVEFMLHLEHEINGAILRHGFKKERFAIRLNGTSDIRFEKIKVRDNKNIFELFPTVQFYDYTKNPKRFDIELPVNYHLTFSRSESNEPIALRLLGKGVNVAWIFNNVPIQYRGYKVIDGDISDLRFLDKKNVIVGLKYKNNTGKGSETDNKFAKTSGFVTVI